MNGLQIGLNNATAAAASSGVLYGPPPLWFLISLVFMVVFPVLWVLVRFIYCKYFYGGLKIIKYKSGNYSIRRLEYVWGYEYWDQNIHCFWDYNRTLYESEKEALDRLDKIKKYHFDYDKGS